jgi:hypothetical protein
MRVLLARCFALLCLLFVCTVAQAQVPSPFVFSLSPQGPAGLMVADFNGDGRPDVIRGQTVFLSNTDGTFTPGTVISVGQNVAFNIIAVADFNGDGRADLLVSANQTFLYVLLGNGDGTFQTPVTTNIGAQLGSIQVADLNGDGKPDVIGIAAPQAGQVFVCLGNGDGTFRSGTSYTVFAGNTISQLTVGDFNGDGKVDIAATGYISNANGLIGVLPGKGDGTFGTAIVSGGVNSSLGLSAGDFNADGKLDLVVSGTDFSNFTEQTYVLIGNGDGTFQTPNSVAPGNGTVSVVDLNKDGKLDLIIWAGPFIEIFLGNGNATFTEKATYPNSTLNFAFQVGVADFNGDGNLDITDGYTAIFGNGDGTFQDVKARLINISGQSALGTVVSGDFNGDGESDLAIGLSGPNPSVYILRGDGTGNYSVLHSYSVSSTPLLLKTADFNNDGKLDLFFTTDVTTTASAAFDILLGNGDGSFAAPVTTSIDPGTFPQVGAMTIADLNGDQFADVTALVNGELTVYLGNGDGTFAAPVSYFGGTNANTFGIGDFNSDGKPDAAVCGSAGLGVLLGKGDGTFLPASFPDPPPPPPTKYLDPTLNCQILATADFNGDGTTDLIVAQFFQASVLLGNGDGTFTTLPSAAPSVGVVADINGDGKLDLVDPSGLSATFGNGDGTFSGTINFQPPWLNPAIWGNPQAIENNESSPAVFAVTDFSGNHRPGIAMVVQGPPGGVIALPNPLPPPSPDFLISAQIPGTVAPAGLTTSTLTSTTVGGFSGDVALSCSGLPDGATCSFAPTTLTGGAGKASLTITTTASAPMGRYPFTVTGTSGSTSHDRALAVTIATSAGTNNVSFLPETLAFTGNVGATNIVQNTTLTNGGSALLQISNISITGANAGDYSVTGNNCGSSVAAYASCQITVSFAPTAAGTRMGALSVTDNATGGVQFVSLSGTAQDFSLAAATTAGSTATVMAGQTATYMLSLAGGGGFSGNVILSCSGAPATTTCAISPATVSVGGATAATATVSVATTARSELLFPVGNHSPREFPGRPTALLAALMAMLILAWICTTRRDQWLRWAPVLTMVLALVLGITLTSCGGGSSGSDSSGGGGGTVPTGTQAGTYTITVSATATAGSSTLIHTTKLTLVVQ